MMPLLSRILPAFALALLASGCAQTPGPQAAQAAPATVSAWTSSADGTRKLEPLSGIALEAGTASAIPDAVDIRIDPSARMQEIVGFGASMTDASAHLIQTALPAPARAALLRELFGAEGLAMDFVRVPIGASDFSSSHYSLNDIPAGEADPALARFSMAEPDREQVPALRAARAINPGLVIMATPWSAPAWMKTTGSLIKGRLRPEAYDAFAAYLARYLREMDARGLPVSLLSIQNEPHFEPENYPGMRVDPAERARFIGRHLGPLLAREGMQARILDWDHNWDQPESPLAVLADPHAARHVAGVAWHCYAGNVSAMEQVRAAHPDKDVFFTECSGGAWAPDWGGTLGWMIDNLIIAPSRAGSRGSLLWNLALDENAGPHLGGCGDCRGVVTIDSRTGAVTRNVEYYVLAHASRFVRQGARRIASTDSETIANAAFHNPDGSLVVIARNRGERPARIRVSDGQRAFAATLPAGEVATFRWRD